MKYRPPARGESIYTPNRERTGSSSASVFQIKQRALPFILTATQHGHDREPPSRRVRRRRPSGPPWSRASQGRPGRRPARYPYPRLRAACVSLLARGRSRRTSSIFGVNDYAPGWVPDVRAAGSPLAGANVVEYRLDVVAEASGVLVPHGPDFGDDRISEAHRLAKDYPHRGSGGVDDRDRDALAQLPQRVVYRRGFRRMVGIQHAPHGALGDVQLPRQPAL